MQRAINDSGDEAIFERPLNDRGKEDAPKMAKDFLKRKNK